MRNGFRQGIVSHQAGGFLQFNGSGNIDLLGLNRPVVVTIAHKTTDYLHTENNTVTSAWNGPFLATENYWIYWEFNLLTFNRTFGITQLEPVAQSVEPGAGDSQIVNVVPGVAGIGFFEVLDHYVLPANKPLTVLNSTNNDGNYTVLSSSFNGTTGKTTIFVNETIIGSTADGQITTDIDAFGNPLKTNGRIWYNTGNNVHYKLNGTVWNEVLIVFAAQILNGNTFISQSLKGPSDFTGTQIGDVSSVLAGRVLFDESSNVLRKDDRTFFTTEDQFFTSASRVDALRLESNVSRAQSIESSLAEFTVVAWKNDGKIGTAQYDDTGETVLGLLTENILLNETGAIIIQGTVTNPNWNWTTGTSPVSVGTPLWVNNGLLLTEDPHVTNAVTYKTARVPVARVLSNDTIIFEQGLGGKGEPGPAGSVGTLPPASIVDLGAVTLVTASSSPTQALVISDTDPRLTDARTPLSHAHAASDVTVVPGFGIVSNNAQGAFNELGAGKLNVSGGTMTGTLTLNADPTSPLESATKQYVDGLVSGLIWLDPIHYVNLVGDNVIDPSTLIPNHSDVHIVPTGAIGAWTGLDGKLVIWNENTVSWEEDLDGILSTHAAGTQFCVAGETTSVPTGTFAGKKNQIAILTDPITPVWSFFIPISNNATFVNNEDSLHAYHQYVFDAFNTKWVEFGGTSAITPGVNINQVGSSLNVTDYGAGGTIDSKFWQGLEPSDLATTYAALTHSHGSTSITTVPYTTSPNWGTPVNPGIVQLNSTNVQNSLNELEDEKASKTPTYTNIVNLPSAASVTGMRAFVVSTDKSYYSNGTSWIELAKNDGTVQNHDHTLPYDITFFIAGPAASIASNLVGTYIATRTVTISAGVLNYYAFAQTAPSANAVYTINVNGVYSGNSIQFLASSNTPDGVFFGSSIVLTPGDRLELISPSTPDAAIENVSISITGCSTMGSCP